MVRKAKIVIQTKDCPSYCLQKVSLALDACGFFTDVGAGENICFYLQRISWHSRMNLCVRIVLLSFMQKLLFHKYWCKRNQSREENKNLWGILIQIFCIIEHCYILTSLKSRINLWLVSMVKYFNFMYSMNKSHINVVPVNMCFTERPSCSIRYPTTNCLPKPKMPH